MKIAIACFLGAFLGALTALKMHYNMWWVGVLVGGLVGYVIYQPKDIWNAVRKVWREMRREMIRNNFSLLNLNEEVKALCTQLVVISLFVLTCTPGFFSAFMLYDSGGTEYMSLRGDLMSNNQYLWLFYFGGTVSTGLMVCLIQGQGRFRKGDWWRGKVDAWSLSPILFAPPILLLIPFVAGIAVLCAIIYYTPAMARFVVRVLRLIHSDIRLLCMTDAALGAVAGFYYGNPLIGGIVGAVLGVLNYEIVSVRLLKLTPAR